MAAMLSEDAYAEAIERRRALHIDGYKTLSDVGFDGEWVTPLQRCARSMTGVVVIAHNWLDERGISQHRDELERFGYGPTLKFNIVLKQALKLANLDRGDIYLTQAFHLIANQRVGGVPAKHLLKSFKAVTKFEIAGRPVVALGRAAERACRETHTTCEHAPHPSGRVGSNCDRAAKIATAILAARPQP